MPSEKVRLLVSVRLVEPCCTVDGLIQSSRHQKHKLQVEIQPSSAEPIITFIYLFNISSLRGYVTTCLYDREQHNSKY